MHTHVQMAHHNATAATSASDITLSLCKVSAETFGSFMQLADWHVLNANMELCRSLPRGWSWPALGILAGCRPESQSACAAWPLPPKLGSRNAMALRPKLGQHNTCPSESVQGEVAHAWACCCTSVRSKPIKWEEMSDSDHDGENHSGSTQVSHREPLPASPDGPARPGYVPRRLMTIILMIQSVTWQHVSMAANKCSVIIHTCMCVYI